MSIRITAAIVGMACTCALAASPFEAFRGKVKEGQYEIKMNMDMPGAPGGMGKQQMTFSNCVTKEDIEKGQMGKRERDMKNCEVKDFNMSGNTATYTTVCKGGPDMTADSKVTFTDNGYVMDMKVAMSQGGQVMNMTQHMESRYTGPCTKK